MDQIIDTILLGVVEGLTEFLPVSSTAHLLVTENLLGLDRQNLEVFTVVIQFGAVLSVVAVYWRKFWGITVALPYDPKARQFAINVIGAFLPSAVLGVLLIKFINGVLLDPVRAMPVIATSWILGGIFILLFERIAPRPRWEGDDIPFWKAFQIGLCQCAALFPGVSRSGATILGGELLGVERKSAAHFTFYLAVPTMMGASVFEFYENWSALSASNLTMIAIGFVVSFLVAYVVVKSFIDFVGRYGLKPFGWYRIASGLLLFAFLYA